VDVHSTDPNGKLAEIPDGGRMFSDDYFYSVQPSVVPPTAVSGGYYGVIVDDGPAAAGVPEINSDHPRPGMLYCF